MSYDSYNEVRFSVPNCTFKSGAGQFDRNFIEPTLDISASYPWPNDRLNGEKVVGIRLSLTITATTAGRLVVYAPNSVSYYTNKYKLLDQLFSAGTHNVSIEPIFDDIWDGNIYPATYTNTSGGFPIISFENYDYTYADGNYITTNILVGTISQIDVYLLTIPIPTIINCI